MPSTIAKPVSIEDVARLAVIATELDELKTRLPEGVERSELNFIVLELHEIAEALDGQNGFGLYASGAGDTAGDASALIELLGDSGITLVVTK